MKAIGFYRYLPVDDPESLLDVEVPTPIPNARDLLVRVRAVSVNPVDVKNRAPRPGRESTPRILGWDAAGVVEAVAAAGYKSVDYILCTNSVEQYVTSMAEIIAPQGKICTIVGTKDNAPIPMNLFMRKSVGFFYELMFTRPVFQTADMQAQHNLLTEAARLVDAGVLHTTLTERRGPLTAANLRHAHARVESGTMIGKLVLRGIEA